MSSQAVVPGWFATHRGRVLALLTLSGMCGLAVFYYDLATSPPGRLPYSLLLGATLFGVFLLADGVITEACWPIRKGAGIATLMWAAQITMVVAGEVLSLGLFQSRTSSIAAVLIDLPLLFLAGWLYWVAGKRNGCAP